MSLSLRNVIAVAFTCCVFITSAALPSALFVHHPSRGVRIHHARMSSKTSPTIEEIKEESEQLRAEIKELKSEALRRLRALEETLGATTTTTKKQMESSSVVDEVEEEGLLPAPPPIVIKSDSSKRKSNGDLLDESVWKVSLSEISICLLLFVSCFGTNTD